MTFALEYRPKRLADLVGQNHIKPILKAMVKSNRIPPALIFVGTRGTGKTSSARIFAAALNCSSDTGDACGECESCVAIQNGLSMSVMEIDAASHGSADDIRGIREMTAYAHGGDWRVVMLDEAHSMSKGAFNALLKLLEEPPPYTVFILLTTEKHKILDTVVSRAMTFEFRRLTIADLVGRLQLIVSEKELDVQPEVLEEIAERAQGGMRDAVMVLEQISHVGVSDVAGFRELFGISNVSVELFTAALEGDHATGNRLIEEYFHRVGDASGMVSDLVGLIKDLLVIHAGGTHVDAALLSPLVDRTEIRPLVGVIRVLWDAKMKVRATDNDQRTSMQMAFALMSDALQPRETPILQGVVANGHVEEERLDIEGLKSVLG